jgi:hypothetical protein
MYKLGIISFYIEKHVVRSQIVQKSNKKYIVQYHIHSKTMRKLAENIFLFRSWFVDVT